MPQIHLKNVRLSFASIFQRSEFNGVEGKYEATFLIPKSNKALKKKLDEAMKQAMVEAKVEKIGSDRYCLKDGDDSAYDGYPGHWSLKAANDKRIRILDRDKTILAEEDGRPYSGCYVNAIIDFWVQDNSWGKRVNANLFGVQFVKDGESFGSAGMSDADVMSSFDELEDEEDDEL